MELNQIVHVEDGMTLSEILGIIRRRMLLILVCSFVTVGLAVAYLIWTPAVYKVTNVIVFDASSGFGISDVFLTFSDSNILTQLASQELKLDKRVLKEITDVKLSPFKRKGIQNDNAIQAEVFTKDMEAGLKLMEFLPQYIETRPYIMSKIETQKMIVQQNLNDLNQCRNDLTRIMNTTTRGVIPNFNIIDLYERYNEHKIMYEKLQSAHIVTLAGDTFLQNRPYKPRVIFILLCGLIMGLVVGCSAAFIMEREWGKPS